ncbi:MAG: histidine--tRNA ligase [Phycisphaerae bacterium]
MANQPIPAVKGTRDLYPAEYAPVGAILETWRQVSLRHGFDEFDGPTLEHTELYTRKSGDEIVEQLFTLTDRGGRSLALRPEMTPTLARMVAARAGSLPRPIKWFCLPRMYRGERPQRGRLREFYQWNADILGVEGPLADAECIFVAVDALRELGLTAADAAVHISDRRLIQQVLQNYARVPPERLDAAFALLDKGARLPREEMARRWGEAFAESRAYDDIWGVLGSSTLADLNARCGGGAGLDAAITANIERLFESLTDFGIADYCKLDLHVVRGLAYYTGVVFEAYDRAGTLRAICGGGRYDNLLETVGGPRLTGAGFGMGDVVLLELLTDLGRVPKLAHAGGGVYVVGVAPKVEGESPEAAGARQRKRERLQHGLVGGLRRGGYRAEFSHQSGNVGKQMQKAAERGAAFVVFVSDRTMEQGIVELKDMSTGQQREVALDELMQNPPAYLGPPRD